MPPHEKLVGQSQCTYPGLLRSNTDRRGQRGRERLKDMRGSLHGDNVALRAQAADDALDRARKLRMAMELIAGMDVGDVNLDDGPVERLEGIVDRNGRERVARGIDDDGVRALARGLDEIDEAPPRGSIARILRMRRYTQRTQRSLPQWRLAWSSRRCAAPSRPTG